MSREISPFLSQLLSAMTSDVSSSTGRSPYSGPFGTPPSGGGASENIQKIPVDFLNEEKTITILAEIPGVTKDSISIEFYNNKLTITCTKCRPYSSVPQFSEVKYGAFERVVALPICITRKETVRSTYQGGVLRIDINKTIEEENKFSIKPKGDDN